jgi:hypothetical protein
LCIGLFTGSQGGVFRTVWCLIRNGKKWCYGEHILGKASGIGMEFWKERLDVNVQFWTSMITDASMCDTYWDEVNQLPIYKNV